MKRELLSNMTIGEEKRLEMAFRSFYWIKRIDKDYFKVKLYNKNGDVLERYRIPVSKIDDIFREF